MGREDHFAIRSMSFIDGENLVFRYQDMLKDGRKANAESLIHHPDVFVWHPHMKGDYYKGQYVRANYYTSAVGTEETINGIRDKIGAILTDPAGYGRRVSANVFKKPNGSKKSKLVDITLTIDVLRHVYGNHVDTVFIFSGDGDFVPVVEEVKRHGKQAVVGALSKGLSDQMRRVGDQFIDLDAWFFR